MLTTSDVFCLRSQEALALSEALHKMGPGGAAPPAAAPAAAVDAAIADANSDAAAAGQR